MRAKPVKLVKGEGYIECEKDEATHVTINFPSPAGLLTLPVITSGTRKGTPCWTWNGDTEKPTLRPSVKTINSRGLCCHSWVDDGEAEFLPDCSHNLVNKTVAMLEVN